MTENKDHIQTFIVPQDALKEALTEQPVDTAPPLLPAEIDTAATLVAEQEDQPKNRRTLRSIIGSAAVTGFIFLSGSQEASAAPADTLTQSPNQGQDALTQYGPLVLTGLGLVVTAAIAGRTMARQSRENRENRFNTTLQSLKGESSGEERVLRLAALNTYARKPEFAPNVFEFAATYLRGRRSGLDIIRKDHAEGTPEFEAAVAERRNADREALKLLLRTLPAARKELVDSRPSRIKRWRGADKQYELDKLTGVDLPDQSRVNGKGINLDWMRDIKRCDFSGMDLTGAGMRNNQFTSVVFNSSRLSEVQFEGSRLRFCDLQGTDARAAHWDGAEITECVIDKDTMLGNLPDSHPDARKGVSIDPNNPSAYRGDPRIVVKDLIPAKDMTEKEVIEQVQEWQKNGLVLLKGSNEKYLLPGRTLQELVKPEQNLASVTFLSKVLRRVGLISSGNTYSKAA
jgi:hypothetical protein